MNDRKSAVFFDRDGVINQPPPEEMRYLRGWEDFAFIDGMIDVLKAVKTKGYPTFLITNQQGVGKGLMTVEELETLHSSLQTHLAAESAAFDAIYAATGLTGEDDRRKPQPTMLFEAREAHQLDLSRSWMIGDHDNDMRAGQAAGTRTIRFRGKKAITVPSDYEVGDAEELLALLEEVL